MQRTPLIILLLFPTFILGSIIGEIQSAYRFFEVWFPKLLPGQRPDFQHILLREENEKTFKQLKVSIATWPLFIQGLTKHFMREIEKVTVLDKDPWEVTEGYQTSIKADMRLVVKVGTIPLDLAPILAIDFGTSSCRISGYSDQLGAYLIHEMPTAVAFSHGDLIVGQDAFDQYLSNCSTGLIHIKPVLGRKFTDEAIRYYIDTPCRNLVADSDGTVQARFAVYDKEFTFPLEMVASKVFSKLKELAEIHLGRVVDKVVLTIPAGVSQSQKLATKEAARLGGLTVVRTVHEPSMAAFSALHGKTGAYDIIVVDIGGGTTDFSFLTRNEKGQFIENALHCDPLFGGSNFTATLATYLEEIFLKEGKINITQKDYETKNPALWKKFTNAVSGVLGYDEPVLIKPKIWHIAEQLKRKFSENKRNTYRMEYFHTLVTGILSLTDLDKIYDTLLTRMEFRLKEFKKIVQDHNKFNKITEFKNIHIYVVGGGSKYPPMTKMVEKMFGKKPERGVDCSSEIVRGAADYAHLSEAEAAATSTSSSSSSSSSSTSGGNSNIIGDAIKLSLLYQKVAYSRVSVAVLHPKCNDHTCPDESTSTIFEKQSKLPNTTKLKLSTVKKNQETANFRVYAGDDDNPKNLILLDTYKLKLKKEPRLVPLEFSLKLDDDGILSGNLCQMKQGGQEIELCDKIEMDIQIVTLPPGHEDL